MIGSGAMPRLSVLGMVVGSCLIAGLLLIIPDFGEDCDTLPKKPKCKDYATSYHDI